MIRNRKKAVYLCTVIVLLTTAGCGHSDTDTNVSTVDVINFNNEMDTDAEERNNHHQDMGEDISNKQDSDTEEQNTAETSKAAEIQEETSSLYSELDGSVESIADNSVIINKTFHPSANISVTYEDTSEKVLVTVYFSEETEFEIWTVKNGGVNGDTDVEKRQGSFSDLKQDAHIAMTGSYDGNDFHADQVIIYSYV